MSSNEPVSYFGLGNISYAKKITIYWPSGAEQVLNNVPSGFIYTISEPENNFNKKNKKSLNNKEKMFVLDKEILSNVRQREKDYDDFKTQKLLPNKLFSLVRVLLGVMLMRMVMMIFLLEGLPGIWRNYI